MGTRIRANSRWDRGGVYQQPHRLKSVAGESGAAAVPAPEEIRTDWLFGVTARTGITRTGTTVTGWADQSGNGRNVSFAAGKEAEYVASYLNSQAAIKLLSTTLGTFGTDNMIASGNDHAIYAVLRNTTEGGTYYHTFCSFRTATANSNANLVVSNDSSYGTFSSILPNASVVGNVAATTTLTNGACSYIQNYNGGTISSAASYSTLVNNSSVAMSTLGGSGTNSSNANQINSYANASPPQFPATNGHLLELWLAPTVFTAGQLTALADFTFSKYGIVQS